MKIRKLAMAAVLTLGMVAFCPTANADNASAEGASFQGKVSSVDPSAKTVVVNGQTYQILATSKITNNQQPATANDLAIGEHVSGKYKKSAENKMEVLTMDITRQSSTAIGGTADNTATQSGSSFSGRVTQIDPAAKTLTVGTTTYQVLATTRITRDSKPSSLNEIRRGQQIAGQYKLSAENKMELLTVDVGGRVIGAVGGTQNNPTTETGSAVSFSGRVTKIDPATQTVTIGARTFQILATSAITTAEGTTTTLADVKASQLVSGTYKKSAEGKLEVLTLHVGTPAKR